MLPAVEPLQLEPLQRVEPVAERVYRELRAALLRQAIAPGQRLVEVDLAQRLGVSRTPVREALARLAAEDMVVVQPSGGLVAKDIREELADIYGLRQVLEGYAARLAAARITRDEIDHLDHLSGEMRRAIDDGDLDRQVEVNNAFHLAVAAASRNSRLIRMINDYRAYFLNIRTLQLYDHPTMLRSQAQHDAIVQALRAGSGEAAEHLVRGHFQDAMAFVLQQAAE